MTMRRGVRAAAAGGLLACLVAGLPVALASLAGNPLPAAVPTADGVWHLLTSPDDGSLFLAALAVAGWLAWGSFTLSVVVEVFSRLTRRQTPAIPGFGGPQRLAAVLIAALATLAVAPTLASGDAAPVEPAPTPVTAAIVDGSPPGPADRDTPPRPAAAHQVRHAVERGEGLLDLQDRYGVPWQRIAEANYGVTQPDGGALQPGQTRIYPGWRLHIPEQVAGATGGATRVTCTAAGHNYVVYEVAAGDWLWHIADRFLGDPERFRDIAELNPHHADRHGDFPDHIEAGWTLRLPADADDRGAMPHAAGVVTPATGAGGDAPFAPVEEPPPPAPTEPPPTVEAERAPALSATPAPPPEHTPPPTATGDAATTSEGEEDDGAAAGDDPAADPERLAPVALASAGLLAALVLGAISRHRQRRRPRHRAGTVTGSPASRRLDRALRVAQQPLDTARVDAALRALAAGLATRAGPLPDIAGVMVTDGAVDLVLHQPCPDPPEPWQGHGDRWHLPAGESLPEVHRTLAPLPALAAVGSQAGRHILLDLERLGVLTLYGQPEPAADLLRYLAAELAHHTWSDSVEVLLAGFPPQEAELLAELSPHRIRVLPSIADGVELIRRRAAGARTALPHAGAADTLAGRVGGLAGDAWMPQVLLAAAPGSADREALALLETELTDAGRCAAAVVTTAPEHRQPGGWRVTVNPDGVLHVRLPFLHTSLSAAALPRRELDLLAGAVRQARVAPAEPVPPAADTERWAVGTDAAGGLRPEVAPDQEPEPHPLTPSPGATARPYADPDLDDDLRAWYVEDPGRPRIAVLGEVRVDAHGAPPESRRRLHAELVVYLAQRGSRGADAARLDEALWPGTGIAATSRQLIVSRARTWLGTDAGGNPWLSDVDEKLTYRLAQGYLLDWHLFRRLRTRGERHGAAGADDLQAALRLVRGAPLDGADRTAGPATRNPYPWLAESDLNTDVLVAAVVDTAHQLAELCLEAGDTDGVRWAVQQAWLADTSGNYDQPWRDLMRAAHADGDLERLRGLVAELMERRDAETAEDLAPDTYHLVHGWLPELAGGSAPGAPAGTAGRRGGTGASRR